jgi:CoA transferase family III
VDVCHDAYGWSGPWRGRRGFDSLVQMSSGIAAEGMRRFSTDRPKPLPVQALDHATGYLVAAAAVRGLTRRHREGRGSGARASLARTAALLVSASRPEEGPAFAPVSDADFSAEIENTTWGPARRMRPAITISGTEMRWDRPATGLGSADPVWLPR